ncbi:MAG: PEP-CTERM sorting domain-containing protein [Telluria sp.]
MKLIRYCLLFLLFAGNQAFASVIYEWRTITPTPQIGSPVGRIEFTFDSWSSGHATSQPTCKVPWAAICEPISPDLVRYKFLGQDVDGLSRLDDWYIDIYFEDEFLRGNIYYNCQRCDNTVWLSGDGVWSLWRAVGPGIGFGCYYDPGCTGLVGEWVFVSAEPDAVVPEPAGPALFALALLALVVARRRV